MPPSPSTLEHRYGCDWVPGRDSATEGRAYDPRMGVAIVSGVFAVALAILSWLLTNGSRRARMLSRIERETAILKDLPEDHPGRKWLSQTLEDDLLMLLVADAIRVPSEDGESTEIRAEEHSRGWLLSPAMAVAVASAVLFFIAGAATIKFLG